MLATFKNGDTPNRKNILHSLANISIVVTLIILIARIVIYDTAVKNKDIDQLKEDVAELKNDDSHAQLSQIISDLNTSIQKLENTVAIMNVLIEKIEPQVERNTERSRKNEINIAKIRK